MGKKGLNGRYGFRLLFRSRDGCGRFPLLRAIVAELGVVATRDLHHVFRIIQLILYALVQRSIEVKVSAGG